MQRSTLREEELAVYVAGLGALVAVPYVLPADKAILVTYGLVLAIASIGFNLLLGYTGLLSFGHAAFWGVGIYSVAFMMHYYGIDSMEALLLGAIATTAVVGAVFGLVCVRYTKIFFGTLTLGFAQLLWGLDLKIFWITGGSDGINVGTPTILFGLIRFSRTTVEFLVHYFYYYVLGLFVIAVVLMWIVTKSPFGMALQSIRDNATRAEFIGIPVRRYKWIAFTISATYTGFAGALNAVVTGIATPDYLYWTTSGKLLFMPLLGGFRSFLGPIVGAFVYDFLETYAVVYVGSNWQLLVGIVIVGLVLLMPAGILGTIISAVQKRRKAT